MSELNNFQVPKNVQIIIPNEDLIFTTNNPQGKLIFLDVKTLQEHIAGPNGDHPERSYLLETENVNLIKSVVTSPAYILLDKSYDCRYNYIDLVAFKGQNTLKNVKIVTENVGNDSEKIITIFPTKKLNETMEGRIIYGKHK